MAQPYAREGQIKIVYGVTCQDIMLCNGPGTQKADVNLLVGAVMDATLKADFLTRYDLECDDQMGPSILEQLVDRGYDPRTLKISINKMEAKTDADNT